jgi:hypothetical protein
MGIGAVMTTRVAQSRLDDIAGYLELTVGSAEGLARSMRDSGKATPHQLAVLAGQLGAALDAILDLRHLDGG